MFNIVEHSIIKLNTNCILSHYHTLSSFFFTGKCTNVLLSIYHSNIIKVILYAFAATCITLSEKGLLDWRITLYEWQQLIFSPPLHGLNWASIPKSSKPLFSHILVFTHSRTITRSTLVDMQICYLYEAIIMYHEIPTALLSCRM